MKKLNLFSAIMRTSSGKPGKPIPKLKSNLFMPRKELLDKLERAFDSHGDVIEIVGAPIRIFFFRNPDHIAAILKHPSLSRIKFMGLTPRLRWVMPKGGVVQKGTGTWGRKRLQVGGAFDDAFLARYLTRSIPIIRGMLQSWHSLEQAKKDTGVFIDIRWQFQTLITQAIFKMFFDKDLLPDAVERIRAATHYVEMSFGSLVPMWVPTPSNLRVRKYTAEIKRTMLGLLNERRKNPKKAEDDLLSVLLILRDEKEEFWKDDEIVDEILSVYFGATVTSAPLIWEFYFISTQPKVRDRLVHEIQTVLQGREPRMEDLPNLPYAEAILKETLRLRAPFTGAFPRLCTTAFETDGYFFPRRSVLIPSSYHAHRHPKFWQDPETFDPDRFLENERNIHPYAYFPFSKGARHCLGSVFAPLFLQLITIMIHQRYVMEFRPQTPLDPRINYDHEVQPDGPVFMQLYPVAR